MSKLKFVSVPRNVARLAQAKRNKLSHNPLLVSGICPTSSRKGAEMNASNTNNFVVYMYLQLMESLETGDADNIMDASNFFRKALALKGLEISDLVNVTILDKPEGDELSPKLAWIKYLWDNNHRLPEIEREQVVTILKGHRIFALWDANRYLLFKAYSRLKLEDLLASLDDSPCVARA